MCLSRRSALRIVLTLLLAASALWLIRPVTSALPDPQSQATHHADTARTLAPNSTFTLTTELLRKLHPALARQLLTSQDERTPVLIVMRAQPDLNKQSITAASTPLDRRAALVNELQATAARSQADVLGALAAAEGAGRASDVRSLWINNSIAARVDRITLLEIAALDDVALVKLDFNRQWLDPTSFAKLPSTASAQQTVEWNIAQIGADRVWSSLGISGTGVVVANLDTGVDWQHPALQAAYRGQNPKGPPNHVFSWFDATDAASQYPYDGIGHGTHTMGTLVGSQGIGVAPGAKWIAARIFDNLGFAYDSWIHAGFQWILAPGGDPAKAPQVLSNSWGNLDGGSTEFQADVQLLNTAGINTFFSNGNGGPLDGTVASPASLPESFGVGAVDKYDQAASFSSRGPSPFGPLKPDLSAPGVNVRSSYPGGAYQTFNGTSMATPHVAGVAALIQAAAPGLSITATRFALTSTAFHPTTDTYPNNVYGWGRVDALQAVLAVAHAGTLGGVVTRSDNGLPISFAVVHAQSAKGTAADTLADANGHYNLSAAAALYTLTVSAFGYVSRIQANVPIISGTVTQRDVALTPLPMGVVTGRLLDVTGTQLIGTLLVQNAPITISVNGGYSLALPIGTHVLQAQSPRHRIVTATVVITVNAAIAQNFVLPAAPSILLVDSGRWYSSDTIGYYRQSLQDLNYLYTEWPVIDLRTDVPTTSTLRPYDVVIWSSPLDSPGYIGAGRTVSNFLDMGGRLFLSGQDVGYYDDGWTASAYYRERLLAELVDDNAASRRLTGTHVFSGQVVSIAGAGGADNQLYPDVIRSLAPLYTEPAFDYAPDQSGGQTIGLCQSYRAVYLSYGFEAINSRAARDAVLSRALDYFGRPPITNDFLLDRAADPVIGPAGSIATATLALYNFDETRAVTFALDAASAWPVSITPAVGMLKSCEHRTFTVTIAPPAGTAPDVSQAITVTAHPIVAPGFVTSSTLIAKTPGSVLLVDDDRWYPVDAAYRRALDANGLSYDVWRVPTSWYGPEPSAPSAARLSWYPQVMWFTGYDWYQPLTQNNEQALQDYLSHGGRVMISSQGYLPDRPRNDFNRRVLGVLDADYDLTVTVASGAAGSLFDGLAFEPIALSYPNYSEALAPQPDTQVALLGQHGWPIALAHDMGISKTLFMAFGFEGLPVETQPEAMNRIVGFLSRLGRSVVKFDRAVAVPGEVVTATLTVTNDGSTRIQRSGFTVQLPAGATLLNGAALTWDGPLAPDQVVTRTYVMRLNASLRAGTIVTLPVEFRDVDQALRFTSVARLTVNAPDLTLKFQTAPPMPHSSEVVTWILTAHNLGADAPRSIITTAVPFGQSLITGTLTASTGTVTATSGAIQWLGPIRAGETITLTYRMTAPLVTQDTLLYDSAVIATPVDVWSAQRWLLVQPYRSIFPLVYK